jgi:hypothetical protein
VGDPEDRSVTLEVSPRRQTSPARAADGGLRAIPAPTRKDAAMRTDFQLSDNSSDSNRGDMNKRGTKRSHMRRLNSRVVLAAAGGLALAGAMSLPAGAATSAHIVAKEASGSQGFSPAVVPTSKIKGQGPTAFFKPSALTVSEDTSGGNCAESNAPVSFVLKNRGTATAYVTFNGSPFGTIPAGQYGTVCVYGGGAGAHAAFGLSNKRDTKTYTGTLTITTSN